MKLNKDFLEKNFKHNLRIEKTHGYSVYELNENLFITFDGCEFELCAWFYNTDYGWDDITSICSIKEIEQLISFMNFCGIDTTNITSN